MVRVDISNSFRSKEDLAIFLETLADQIRQGFTSGYYPYWTLTEDDDSDNE